MTVDDLQVAVSSSLHFKSPVPIQIALATTPGPSVALTDQIGGIYHRRNGEMWLLLDYGGPWCDLRISWTPANSLRPAVAPGGFTNLTNLLVAKHVGQATLKVEVMDRSSLGTDYPAESAEADFTIYPLRLTMPTQVVESTELTVGQSVPPRRRALTAIGQLILFDPAKAFEGALDLPQLSSRVSSASQLVQAPVQLTDVETETPAGPPAPVPFSMGYSWQTQPASPSPARFDAPPPARLGSPAAAEFEDGHFRIIHARREGPFTLTTEPSENDPNYEFAYGGVAYTREDVYDVKPFPLTATLVPSPDDDHNGNLLFEDRWLEDPTHPQGGRLVSSFDLEVRRGSEVIYRSWEEAAFEVEMQPGRLYLRKIHRVNADGTRTPVSFDLSIRSGRPDLVDFWLAAGEAPGQVIRRTLNDIMMVKAYSANAFQITVALMDLADPVPLEQDVYVMPKFMALDVEIAPPLEADLMTWIDGYFRDANVLDLHLHPNEEVIYDTGQIQGLVRGHNPDSESEVISLKVIPEGVSADDADEMTIVFGSDAAHREEFTATVVGLELGGNLIRMTATKPINLVTTGPSEDEVTLEGVPPRDVSLQGLDADQNGVNDSGIVLKRDAGRFEWTYSKATSARLVYRAPDGARDWDTYGLGYELEGDTVNVTLDRDTGMHTLQFIATNVFADVESQPFEMQAPEPELTPDFQTWNLPHHPTDSLYVGNSVSEVDLRITVLHCLYYEVFDGTSTVQEDPASPFASTTATRTVSLDEGDNFFTFTYNNEFASPFTPPIKVRRRRFVFDVEGSLEVRPLDTNQEAIVELVDIQPPEFGNLLPGSLQIVFDITFAVPESASPIGFDSMKWRIKDRDDDHSSDDRPSTLDYRIAFSAASFDPDFVKSISFMEILASDVDEDDPNSDPFPMWSLADTSGLVLDGANRYWSRAHVFASAGELWIPIHTRAAS